jgi:hypothetical protein
MVGYVAPRFSGTDALGSKALRWMSDPNINRSSVNPRVVTNFCSSTFLRKVIIQPELLAPRVHGNRDEHPCSRLFCRGNLSPPPLLSISLQAKTTLPNSFNSFQTPSLTFNRQWISTWRRLPPSRNLNPSSQSSPKTFSTMPSHTTSLRNLSSGTKM